ncbi:MAG: hypothetical protein KAR79_06380, partial [Simkaniaceae bacterium]|nr:hypothetical protein [Simkaniaceae bacterium]
MKSWIFFFRKRVRKWLPGLIVSFFLLFICFFHHAIICKTSQLVLGQFVFKKGKVHFSYDSLQL